MQQSQTLTDSDIDASLREAEISPADVLFDPEEFAAHFLWILNKQKQSTLLRYNAAQRHFMAHRTGRDLILKARQLGFSTAVQGEMFRRAITSTRTTMTMAHDDQTTQKLRRIQERFWEHCRIATVQPARAISNAVLVTYPDFDSTCVIATAGSKEAGRGDTYTDFHGSEVAFWPDAERILAGAMQGGDPDVVLESTPNGSVGWFYERCMDAMRGDPTWKLHFYPWWWDVDYKLPLAENEKLEFDDEEKYLIGEYNLTAEQIKWRRKKKSELKRLFPQEYPESPELCFLGSGDSYFGDIERSFAAPAYAEPKLLSEVRESGLEIPPHKYSAGLDWGQENDYTVLSILDITTKQQVDLYRVNRLSWGEIRKRVATRLHHWGIKTVVAEANSIGSVNIEELRKLEISVVPFNTTNTTKSDLMSDLYNALHEENLTLLSQPDIKHQFNSFVSTKLASGAWRIAASGHGHDDIVIATGLSWFARKYIKVQVWP
jgi:hypothetical protein